MPFTSFQLGLIGALIIIIAQSMAYIFVFDFDLVYSVNWLIPFILAYTFVFGLQNLAIINKKRVQNGWINYKQALKESFTVTVISIVFSSIASWLFQRTVFHTKADRLMQNRIDQISERIQEKGAMIHATQEQINSQIDQVNQYFKAFITLELPVKIIIGFIFSFLLSLAYSMASKKKERTN